MTLLFHRTHHSSLYSELPYLRLVATRASLYPIVVETMLLCIPNTLTLTLTLSLTLTLINTLTITLTLINTLTLTLINSSPGTLLCGEIAVTRIVTDLYIITPAGGISVAY